MINYIEFLRVANLQKTGLGTNTDAADFIRNNNGRYKDLKIEISYGIGRASGIPWIAFLGYNQKVQNGIYPVLLYYKDFDLLILCYGVSENNVPEIKWDLPANTKSVRQYFKENNLKHPSKYGNSLVYKVYDPGKINNNAIVKDLDILIKEFKQTMEKGSYSKLKKQGSTVKSKKTFNIKDVKKAISDSNLVISDLTLTRFIASLLTKPFVILTGLSGSGKTKLAHAFVKWICKADAQYCLVPVGADWTNRDPILGYPNALDQAQYTKPDNGVVDLMINAHSNPNLPHFLILDEMNLSHVERYFADFLSAMESGGKISFHSGEKEKNGVPPSLTIPENLFVIGTINVDETTYMFSPKVLDRANVIEFRISNPEMEKFLENPLKPNLKELMGKGSEMAESFMQLARKLDFDKTPVNSFNKKLIEFFSELKKTGAEFGYRSAYEIHRLIDQLTVIDLELNENEKLDIAIMQKLLPKLHGSRRKLCPVLLTIGEFCVQPGKFKDIEKEIYSVENFIYIQEHVKFPLSLEKISRMFNGAVDNGFASYAEA